MKQMQRNYERQISSCSDSIVFVFVCVQVLEEREKLKQERDIRMKKKEYLMKELERLRKQQGKFTQGTHKYHIY